MSAAKKRTPRCRKVHVTREQLLAIEEASSIVERMAQSYEFYGGVDLPKMHQDTRTAHGTDE